MRLPPVLRRTHAPLQSQSHLQLSTDSSLVVRGKWAHGRTFTSLGADYLILSALSAYGLGTNIAKSALSHYEFFSKPLEGDTVTRLAWNMGAASFVLNWAAAVILIFTLAFEFLWTTRARRVGFAAPLRRPFAYEPPVRAQNFTVDEHEEKVEEVALVTPLDKAEGSTSRLQSRNSPTSPSTAPTHSQLEPDPSSSTRASATAQPEEHHEDLPGYFEGNSTAAAYYAAAAAYIAAAEMAASGRTNTFTASASDITGQHSEQSLAVTERDRDAPIDVSSIGHSHKRPSTASGYPPADPPSPTRLERDPARAVRRLSSPLETLKRDTLALLRSQSTETRPLPTPPKAPPSNTPSATSHPDQPLPPPTLSTLSTTLSTFPSLPTTPRTSLFNPPHPLPPLPPAAAQAAAAARARAEPSNSDELRAWKQAVLDALEREGSDVPQWKRDMLDALERDPPRPEVPHVTQVERRPEARGPLTDERDTVEMGNVRENSTA
ncbi:unnamed protein product [Cutaneotrichosporon oleaginosum]